MDDYQEEINTNEFENVADGQQNIHDDDDDEDEEELITAQKLLESLQKTWLNEKFAPEILPHQSDMLNLMLGQIIHMEENIKQLNKNDFRLITHKMELERIKYMICSYLRCRLKKIENFCQDILNEEADRTVETKRLSNEETEFANSYLKNRQQHFRQLAQKHMPLNLQEQTVKEIVRPNRMEHIFLKAIVSVPSVIIGKNDEEIDLVAESRHIMPYNLAAEFIIDGRAQLI